MPKFLKDFFDKKGKKGVQNLLLMLLAGVVLLFVSAYFANMGGDDDILQSSSAVAVDEISIYQSQTSGMVQISAAAYLARQLEEILSLVAGAGEVRVMLTIGNASRYFAQNTQENASVTIEEDSEGGVRNVESTNLSVTYVMVRQTDGSEAPLLLTEVAPNIEGVIIVAQGGQDAAVRAALTHAVQALLGVAAHRVQVFQMQ